MNTQGSIVEFQGFPPTSLWRLFIDGNRQLQAGPGGFDVKEPGYLKSLFIGFNWLLETLEETPSLEYLQKLHQLATSHTKLSSTGGEGRQLEVFLEDFPRGIRNTGVRIELEAQGINANFTEAGLKELYEKLKTGDTYFSFQRRDPIFGELNEIDGSNVDKIDFKDFLQLIQKEFWTIDLRNSSVSLIEPRIHKILARYNQDIEKTKSDDEKLFAIASCVHELELSHSFFDGNCRTFAILFLIKLLLQQKFSPAILENPNRFDAYSVAELVQEIKNGMKVFQAFKKQLNDKPREECTEDAVIYLRGNNQLANLLAFYTISHHPHWEKINPEESAKAIEIITRVLSNLSQDALTYDQLQTVLENISDYLMKATYQKSFYQVNFFASVNDYGIHFDSNINRLIHTHVFEEQALKEQIETRLSSLRPSLQ